MKPTRFRYYDPDTLEETLGLLADLGDEAVLLAGGQSLVPMMNLRLVQAAHVVDLNRVLELAHVRGDENGLVVGAMARHKTVERSLEAAERQPLLVEAMPWIGYPAIRTRGTIGGSIVHADPAAELPCVLLAGGARLLLASKDRAREVAADEFFLGPYITDRAPDEMLVEVRFPPLRPGSRTSFREFARKSGEFGLVLIAASLSFDDGICTHARAAIGGVSSVPHRLDEVERILEGSALDTATINAACAAGVAGVAPRTDAHATAEYRRRIVGVELRRAFETISACHAVEERASWT